VAGIKPSLLTISPDGSTVPGNLLFVSFKWKLHARLHFENIWKKAKSDGLKNSDIFFNVNCFILWSNL